MQELSGGSVWILGISYIVKFCIEAVIVVSYDKLVFAPILSQMIDSFTEIIDLVGFIVWVVYKYNL